MIASTHRFHGFGGLNGVYRRGQTVRSPLASLKFSAQNQKKGYRLAVVVSRKVNKLAVVRNRIRRRIYEIVRSHQLEIGESYDLVITVFSDQLASMAHKQLESVLMDLLAQAHAITSNTESAQVVRHDIVKRNGN